MQSLIPDALYARHREAIAPSRDGTERIGSEVGREIAARTYLQQVLRGQQSVTSDCSRQPWAASAKEEKTAAKPAGEV